MPLLITEDNWRSHADKFPHFSRDEIASPESGIIRVPLNFLLALEALRQDFGQPMIVNSACRTSIHNVAVGGHRRSLHRCDVEHRSSGVEGTLAVDISAQDGWQRGTLFARAWAAGWSIGWGGTFLHLDKRTWVGLPQNTFNYRKSL